MFYRSPLDSLLYLAAFSLLVSLDSLTLVQLFTEEKKKRKKPLFVPPPPFVITKEQTHIKHTQGAEAVIAVSAVLLWVAGDDNISHRYIYIIFLIMSSLNCGQLEAGHIPEKTHFFNRYRFCLLWYAMCLDLGEGEAPLSVCIC